MSGFTAKQADGFSRYRTMAGIHPLIIPNGANGFDSYIGARIDLTVGLPFDVYTGPPKFFPYPQSVSIFQVDAAGGDLVMTMYLEGHNIWGGFIKETMAGLTIAAANPAQSLQAFRDVTLARILVATAGAAGDAVRVGMSNGNGAATRANYAIPTKKYGPNNNPVLGLAGATTPGALAVGLTLPTNFSAARGTVQFDVSSTAGNNLAYMLLHPDSAE